MMNFIDGYSDLNTVNFLAKSLNPECLEKALNRSGLVQKEVQYKTQSGKSATRKQWVKAGEEQNSPTEPVNNNPVETPTKRPQVPATPFNITDRIKHLKPVNNIAEVPEHIIKKLNKPIPPTWRNIMVSLDPDADVLVVGKDDMNRPQYIYNPKYVKKGQTQKFNRVQELMKKKEKVTQVIDLMDDKDTADCLSLIFHMGIRPGSTRDTKAKVEALGATTLRGENVVEEDGKVFLRFTGKKGVQQDHEVINPKLAKMLVNRKEKSGEAGDLFHTNDVKLRDALKPLNIHPKDLRTLLATSTAQELLAEQTPTDNPKEFVKIRNMIGDQVCKVLGNQRKMALIAYIDPTVFEEWAPQGMAAWKRAEEEKRILKQSV